MCHFSNREKRFENLGIIRLMNFIDQILNLEYYFNYAKMLEDFKVQLISSKLESNIQKVGGMVGSISKREELKLRIFFLAKN